MSNVYVSILLSALQIVVERQLGKTGTKDLIRVKNRLEAALGLVNTELEGREVLGK